MHPRAVVPDESLLGQIFPDQKSPTVSLILQTWHKCIFKAEFEGRELAPVIVRLEAQDGDRTPQFEWVAALQKIAATRIPDLIPNIHQVGAATNAKGRVFQFCVMELAEGETLEDVWEKLTDENQVSIVRSIVAALEKLQTLRMTDHEVQSALLPVFGNDNEAMSTMALGGPAMGLHRDGRSLLAAILDHWKLERTEVCRIEPVDDGHGVLVKSSFAELDPVTVENAHFDQWPHQAVLCHNDLTPRNLILKPFTDPEGHVEFKLAAIIDWELGGFYPPSYQLGLQDSYLSTANQHIRFYLLLKEHMQALVPRTESQLVLLQAHELIVESQHRELVAGLNIPAHIRLGFMEMMCLKKDDDPYMGWVHDEKKGPLATHADAEKQADEVIEDILARREARAKARAAE